MTCECGYEANFENCCGRFLGGEHTPETAVELMRSRFVAFGLGDFDYIEQTQIEPLPPEVRQRQAPEWEKLEIVSEHDGGPGHETGVVEFVAYYKLAHGPRLHRESSRFIRVNGEWRYLDGDIVDEDNNEVATTKISPTQPCPCGSGRKFGRCCGLTFPKD